MESFSTSDAPPAASHHFITTSSLSTTMHHPEAAYACTKGRLLSALAVTQKQYHQDSSEGYTRRGGT